MRSIITSTGWPKIMPTRSDWPTCIRGIDEFELRPAVIDTNIVIFAVDPKLGTATEFATALKDRGLFMLSVGPQLIRAVTHLDVDGDDVRSRGRDSPRYGAGRLERV